METGFCHCRITYFTMKPALEIQVIHRGLAYWSVYDPSVKTELCCCAFETSDGIVICDPVPLAEEAREELFTGRNPCGILLTSANHDRDSAAWAQHYGVEIWAHTAARGHVQATRWFEDGETVFGAKAISLDGFAVGETAFWRDGLLFLGDALIHIEPYGFAMLPDKYCEDPKAARESLKKLLPCPAETLTFAHGLPIVARAAERLAALVNATGRAG